MSPKCHIYAFFNNVLKYSHMEKDRVMILIGKSKDLDPRAFEVELERVLFPQVKFCRDT